RLTAAGWRMRRLGQPSVYHCGHATAAFPLLLRRWKTRYLHGHGELLRSKWGTDLWWRCLRGAKLSLAVILWWGLLLALLAASLVAPTPGLWTSAFAVLLVAPLLLQ